MSDTTEQVEAAMEKIRGTACNFDYMTEGLADVILQAAINSAGQQTLRLVAEGVKPSIAAQAGQSMVLPMAFNFGLAVGKEMAASTSFSDMMLGLGGFDADVADAGESEHGGE